MEIRDFYLGEHAARVALVGVYLAPFSGIAFLWFIAVIRNLIADREDRFFATVFLGSGLLFVAMLFLAAGAGGALLIAVKFQDEPLPSADSVVIVRSLAFGFLFIYAMRMAAVFMIVVSTIGMRLAVFPRWLVVAGYIAALVLILNVSYTTLLILVFPAWVAAVSIVILRATPGGGERVSGARHGLEREHLAGRAAEREGGPPGARRYGEARRNSNDSRPVGVLIVDDQPTFRKALRDLVAATPGLALAGEVDSGEAAIDAVEALAPRMVIMDKRMPGMGGVEATRRIVARHPDTVVLLVSVEIPELELMQGCGAAAFLRKQQLSPRELSAVWQAHGA